MSSRLSSARPSLNRPLNEREQMRLQQRVTASEQASKALTTKTQFLEEENAKLEVIIRELKISNKRLEEELVETKERCEKDEVLLDMANQANSTNERLKDQITSLKAELKKTTEELREREDELVELRSTTAKHEELELKHESLGLNHQRNQSELDDERRRREKAENDRDEAYDKIDQLQQQLTDQKLEAVKFKHEAEKLKTQVDKLRRKKIESKNQHQQAAKYTHLEETVNDLELENLQLRQAVKAHEENIKSLNEEVDRSRKMAEGLSPSLTRSNNELREAKRQIEDLLSTKRDLQQLVTTLRVKGDEYDRMDDEERSKLRREVVQMETIRDELKRDIDDMKMRSPANLMQVQQYRERIQELEHLEPQCLIYTRKIASLKKELSAAKEDAGDMDGMVRKHQKMSRKLRNFFKLFANNINGYMKTVQHTCNSKLNTHMTYMDGLKKRIDIGLDQIGHYASLKSQSADQWRNKYLEAKLELDTLPQLQLKAEQTESELKKLEEEYRMYKFGAEETKKRHLNQILTLEEAEVERNSLKSTVDEIMRNNQQLSRELSVAQRQLKLFKMDNVDAALKEFQAINNKELDFLNGIAKKQKAAKLRKVMSAYQGDAILTVRTENLDHFHLNRSVDPVVVLYAKDLEAGSNFLPESEWMDLDDVQQFKIPLVPFNPKLELKFSVYDMGKGGDNRQRLGYTTTTLGGLLDSNEPLALRSDDKEVNISLTALDAKVLVEVEAEVGDNKETIMKQEDEEDDIDHLSRNDGGIVFTTLSREVERLQQVLDRRGGELIRLNDVEDKYISQSKVLATMNKTMDALTDEKNLLIDQVDELKKKIERLELDQLSGSSLAYFQNNLQQLEHELRMKEEECNNLRDESEEQQAQFDRALGEKEQLISKLQLEIRKLKNNQKGFDVDQLKNAIDHLEAWQKQKLTQLEQDKHHLIRVIQKMKRSELNPAQAEKLREEVKKMKAAMESQAAATRHQNEEWKNQEDKIARLTADVADFEMKNADLLKMVEKLNKRDESVVTVELQRKYNELKVEYDELKSSIDAAADESSAQARIMRLEASMKHKIDDSMDAFANQDLVTELQSKVEVLEEINRKQKEQAREAKVAAMNDYDTMKNAFQAEYDEQAKKNAEQLRTKTKEFQRELDERLTKRVEEVRNEYIEHVNELESEIKTYRAKINDKDGIFAKYERTCAQYNALVLEKIELEDQLKILEQSNDSESALMKTRSELAAETLELQQQNSLLQQQLDIQKANLESEKLAQSTRANAEMSTLKIQVGELKAAIKFRDQTIAGSDARTEQLNATIKSQQVKISELRGQLENLDSSLLVAGQKDELVRRLAEGKKRAEARVAELIRENENLHDSHIQDKRATVDQFRRQKNEEIRQWQQDHNNQLREREFEHKKTLLALRKEQQQELTAQKQQFEIQTEEYKRKIERLEADVKKFGETIRSMKDQAKEVEAARNLLANSAEDEISTLERKLQDALQGQEDLKLEMQKVQNECRRKLNEARDEMYEEEKGKLSLRVQRMADDSVRKEREVDEYKRRLDQANVKMERLRMEVQTLRNEKAELEIKNNALSMKIRLLEEEKTELDVAKRTMELRAAMLQERSKALESDLGSYQASHQSSLAGQRKQAAESQRIVAQNARLQAALEGKTFKSTVKHRLQQSSGGANNIKDDTSSIVSGMSGMTQNDAATKPLDDLLSSLGIPELDGFSDSDVDIGSNAARLADLTLDTDSEGGAGAGRKTKSSKAGGGGGGSLSRDPFAIETDSEDDDWYFK